LDAPSKGEAGDTLGEGSSRKSEKHVAASRLASFTVLAGWVEFNRAGRWLRYRFDLCDLPEIPVQFCLRTDIFVAFVRVQLFPAEEKVVVLAAYLAVTTYE
jgi:hypothetical protein